jgi:hypothetical protein
MIQDEEEEVDEFANLPYYNKYKLRESKNNNSDNMDIYEHEPGDKDYDSNEKDSKASKRKNNEDYENDPNLTEKRKKVMK